MAAEGLLGLQIDENEFVDLLGRVMQHAQYLQNKPPQFVPKEDLPATEVVEFLRPYTVENGGPLIVKKFTYAPDRSNVIIQYPGTTDKVVSFVGSHMDVVCASPEDWARDPFQLQREGDKLYGRGVTDCLGHVALIPNVFKQLAILRPTLKIGVVAVLIANEENSDIPGVGVDELARRGELEFLKNGPLIWLDSADIGPTLGTGGVAAWRLTARGKLFHSGVPQKAINSIELAYEALRVIQDRFYQDYAYGEQERRYLFNVGSSLKPTQMRCAPGGLNQIPGWATIEGDMRITPFHEVKDVMQKVEQYVREIDVATLPSFGYSKFHLPDEALKGVLELEWLGEPNRGVACNLDSPGYRALHDAIAAVRGQARPFSLTGSLPIIRDLQDAGFDVQVTGFGRMDAYHALNEYALISEFKEGAQILFRVIHSLNESA
eukprot:TRINITY_DN280_c0_g1_i1.p1 TRINITY_DN280_c0_g1~~TRINITY_DN280_c0_g1_i1.p1  ORF type:complete len:434 (-),score=191.11 TRINITY_DN280_c0_g1_i1:127-1428(-)